MPEKSSALNHKSLLCVLYIIINLSHGSSVSADCFVEKNFFSDHLGSKTAYNFVANKDDSPIAFDGCEPRKVWMVIRHGSRYPSSETLLKMRELNQIRDDILDNHNRKRGKLCSNCLSKLTEWSLKVDPKESKILVHEGEDEMIELAERFQKRFPQLFPDDYHNNTYKFRHTATQRTKESKRFFTVGLFGRKVARYVWDPEPIDKDPLLRFYQRCSKWNREIKHNKNSYQEKYKFLETDYIDNVVIDVSRRLGFNRNLTVDELLTMHLMCSFESAWTHHHTSPWCFLFNKEELQVLEYVDDLKKYWVSGYGHDINYQQACPLVKDMFQHMTQRKKPRSTFYFTHSGALLKVLAHLGLYKDREPLRHDNFSMDRLWRTSKIDAFATNVAFILFWCEDGEKVLTMHQERPVRLPGCEEELCPLHVFEAAYHDSIYNCNVSKLCSVDSDRHSG